MYGGGGGTPSPTLGLRLEETVGMLGTGMEEEGPAEDEMAAVK